MSESSDFFLPFSASEGERGASHVAGNVDGDRMCDLSYQYSNVLAATTRGVIPHAEAF